MNSKNILIRVNQLYKIFGDGDKSALDLVKNGMSKDELLEKSNCVLGLNNINLKINDLEILGYYLPVIKVECIYQKSVRLEDIINIKCRIFSIPKSKLRFDYDVLKNDEKVKVASGYTEHAFLNIKKNKPAKPPTSLLNKIKLYF